MAEETQTQVAQAPKASRPTVETEGKAIMFRPKNFEELWGFAKIISETDFVPAGDRNKPGQVLAKIQYGSEVGLPPMQSLRWIAFLPNGLPIIWGSGAKSIVLSHSLCEWIKELDPEEAYKQGFGECEIKRRGWSHTVKRRFTKEMAEQAGLWGGKGDTQQKREMSTWFKYPGRMLQWRAFHLAVSDSIPEALAGLTPEAIAEDFDMEITATTTAEPEKPIALPKPKETKAELATMTNTEIEAQLKRFTEALEREKNPMLRSSLASKVAAKNQQPAGDTLRESGQPAEGANVQGTDARQGEAKDGKGKSKAKPAEVKRDPPKEDEPQISLKNQLLAWVKTCSYDEVQSFDRDKSRIANEVMGIRDPMERQEVLTAWDLERRTRPEPREPGQD